MKNKMLELTRPFPGRYVSKNPSGGGTYVKHHVVNQRLIEVLGTPPDFRMISIIRGDVDGYTTEKGKTYPDIHNVIVGVICEMRADLGDNPGFESTVVQEAGDCEQPHNWKTDGARLKDAMSDAYKRCGMRLGCALHLWSQDEYFLYDHLKSARSDSTTTSTGPESEPQDGGDAAASPAPSSQGDGSW